MQAASRAWYVLADAVSGLNQIACSGRAKAVIVSTTATRQSLSEIFALERQIGVMALAFFTFAFSLA